MDWNFQVDIASAKYALEHSDPVLVPLSVTVETALRRAYLSRLRKAGKLGELLTSQAEAWSKDHATEEKIGATCKGLPPDILNFQHDSLACALALGWADGLVIDEVRLVLKSKIAGYTKRLPKTENRHG